VAVISGGSSGIGLAVARELGALGYSLHLIARDPVRLEAARQSLSPARVTIHAADVADEPIAAGAIADVLAQEGRIDWLVTSAGMAEPGLFLDQDIEITRHHMEVNFLGTANLVHPVAKIMADQGGGRITLISSALAFGGVVGYAAYGPSKFAVRGLAETLVVELAPLGISVSVAYPPDTETPQLQREATLRPEATRRIAAEGGVMSAEAVARNIVTGALKGRFVLAPGMLMQAFGWFHSLIAPALRARQAKIMAAVQREEQLKR
jgi:3-dehydrosphinganine reductase